MPLISERYRWDLTAKTNKNQTELGRAFRDYYGFVEAVRKAGTEGELYRALPNEGRSLYTDDKYASALEHVYRTFSDEFVDTFET